MKIVFMGTPDFALGCLQSLYDAGHEIVSVFTQQDKPRGRKGTVTPPEVKVRALELGLAVHQPASMRDPAVEQLIRSYAPDYLVVVAYGKILPAEILGIPKFGAINVHASLLPRYRGASPIQWAIVSGEQKTGVTTMLMDEGLDTGDMLLKDETDIGEFETAQELFKRLADIGANLIVKTIEHFPDIKPVKQNSELSTYAPIINKEMGKIDFNLTAQQIHDLVRGFTPWPGAHFIYNDKRVKVQKTKPHMDVLATVGEVVECKNSFIIGCAKGAIEILEVVPEGKKSMAAVDMMNGLRIKKGSLIV